MADTKLTALSAITALTADDLLYVVDDPGGTPASKKITAANAKLFFGGLAFASTQTASFTMAVGSLYPVDLSGAGADFVATFPSASAGDMCGWFVKTPHSSCTYGCEPLSTTSIRGGTSHDNCFSLFQKGEVLIFIYDGATWQIPHDGRIPFACRVTLASDLTGEGAVTWTAVPFDTESFDNGSFFDHVTNKYATTKRKGKYDINIMCGPVNSVSDGKFWAMLVADAVTPTVTYCQGGVPAMGATGGFTTTSSAHTGVLSVGTVIRGTMVSEEGSKGVKASQSLGRTTYLSIQEILE